MLSHCAQVLKFSHFFPFVPNTLRFPFRRGVCVETKVRAFLRKQKSGYLTLFITRKDFSHERIHPRTNRCEF